MIHELFLRAKKKLPLKMRAALMSPGLQDNRERSETQERAGKLDHGERFLHASSFDCPESLVYVVTQKNYFQ